MESCSALFSYGTVYRVVQCFYTQLLSLWMEFEDDISLFQAFRQRGAK